VPLRRSDIFDTDVVDAVRLASPGTTVNIAGVTVVSTTAGTKTIQVSGFHLVNFDDNEVIPGDIVVLSGTSAADGTYTVASITDDTHLVVVETIATSTGGTASFRYPAGATTVGVATTGFVHPGTAATVAQLLLAVDTGSNYDLLLENEPPAPTNNYAATRSGGVVTTETWTRNGGNKQKDIVYTRAGGVVTQELRKVYATDGTTILAQETVVYTRSGGVVVSATRTRNV
jgi:hypothetical protein